MWQPEATRIIRYLLDDIDSPQLYSDARLEESFLIIAQMIQNDITFTQTYNIDVDQVILSPDPTEDPKDIAFLNLTCLKTVCMIASAELKKAAREAINIRDHTISVDMKGVFEAKKVFAKQMCENYDEARLAFEAGDMLVGSAIIGPYGLGRSWARDNYNCTMRG